jgi:ribosomal protein S15P/S13E
MMLKLLIYAYINNNYSSRNIEAACKENVNYMWLTGMQNPDHNTINFFRSGRMKIYLKEAFSQIVIMLYQENILDIKDLYTDGTIMEADANKYTFVWSKSIKNNKTRILNRLDEIWQQAEKVTKKEIMDTRPTSIEELSPESVIETIEKIQKHIDGYELDKATKRKLYYSKSKDVKNIEKYNENEKILGERNSYSKTDQDAVFMRTKDDHFKNG